MADRGEQSTADYEARANDAWTLVQSFQPRDTIDLMLTGQFISMNELFADNAGDILRGMPDSLKQRARSSAVAMGRLALAQVGELERRGIQPYRSEAAPEQRPASAVKAPAAEQSKRRSPPPQARRSLVLWPHPGQPPLNLPRRRPGSTNPIRSGWKKPRPRWQTGQRRLQ